MLLLRITEWLAWLLQLGVGIYALRLNRLFGTRRIGWSLFTAFTLLGAIHLAQAAGGLAMPGNSSLRVGLLEMIISLLVLMSLLHIEAVFREKLRLERSQLEARANLEAVVKEQTAELSSANEQLCKEIERGEEHRKALEESREQYRALFEQNPQPMWVFDRHTFEFLAINEAALRHYGFSYQEFCTLTAKHILPAEDMTAFIRDVAKNSSAVEPRGLWRHYKKGGSIADVEVASTDLVYKGHQARLVLAEDVTDRLALERQVRQGQKMEAVGQLAGGVAHDFNNLLTVIRGHTELLLQQASDNGAAEHARQIAAAAERATQLTRQLLTFSRRNVMRMASVDLNGLVENLTKMLRRLIGEDVVLETSYGSALPRIRGDAATLEQVLINLVVNARDAMLPKGGVLNIRTGLVRVNTEHVHRHPEARVGDFLYLAVRDSGCGITPEVMAHLFEPFFTTKDVGKGTGLGLATVDGIIKQHAGWIEVSTALRAGTEFQVFLPAAPQAELQPEAKVQVAAAASPGNQTILLVEDEPAVRELGRTFLEQFGYRVMEADCAAAALALWKEKATQVDLLLTDVVMPGGMSGRDLAEVLKRSRPGLKVVYASGYSPSRTTDGPKVVEGVSFLPKPYSAGELIAAVQGCLREPAPV